MEINLIKEITNSSSVDSYLHYLYCIDFFDIFHSKMSNIVIISLSLTSTSTSFQFYLVLDLLLYYFYN